MKPRRTPLLALAACLAAGCASLSLPPRPATDRDRGTVMDAARRASEPAPRGTAKPRPPQSPPSRRRPPARPVLSADAPPPARRAPPPPGATAYATSAGEDHTLRTPALVVAVMRDGRTSAEGRFLDARGLETRLRALSRERHDAVVIVRPVPGAPQRRVRDVAALCDRIGLHCLPFPAQ